MWNDAIQRSTQLVTDALLHRRVLPVEALAFERVSGVLAVRTALRLHCGPQALLFAVPEATASTARQVIASLLIGDHAHAHGEGALPEWETRRVLRGDVLLVTEAISESKARLDELHLGRGQLLSD